jgi:hypothetical protein
MGRIPPTYKEVEFRIPACEKCGDDLIRFMGRWACKKCLQIPHDNIFGTEFAGLMLGDAFPNREARRRFGL